MPLFKERITTIPEAADGLKQIARERLAWLDTLIGGQDYIAGDKMTLVDVLLYCMLAFGQQVGQAFDESLPNIKPWFDRMAARDSAGA